MSDDLLMLGLPTKPGAPLTWVNLDDIVLVQPNLTQERAHAPFTESGSTVHLRHGGSFTTTMSAQQVLDKMVDLVEEVRS